ncbi:hypothetical protein VNO77_19346 [Canavalia gladiata]|uniref:Uncharacterized protein n=1 Tax=Canavalia gladiata TaxID=3824 RepID=A0AAN9QKE8_CANGL
MKLSLMGGIQRDTIPCLYSLRYRRQRLSYIDEYRNDSPLDSKWYLEEHVTQFGWVQSEEDMLMMMSKTSNFSQNLRIFMRSIVSRTPHQSSSYMHPRQDIAKEDFSAFQPSNWFIHPPNVRARVKGGRAVALLLAI